MQTDAIPADDLALRDAGSQHWHIFVVPSPGSPELIIEVQGLVYVMETPGFICVAWQCQHSRMPHVFGFAVTILWPSPSKQ
jgi:hypothetical protein